MGRRRQGRDWLRDVPRHLFRYRPWLFAAYAAGGFLLAGFLHYRTWARAGSPSVATVFDNLAFPVPGPSPFAFFVVNSVFAVGVFGAVHLLVRRLHAYDVGEEVVFWGLLASVALAWLPWLWGSSVTNSAFEGLFVGLAFIGFGVSHRLRLRPVAFDAWKALASVLKGCVAVLAIVLGAVATATLTPWERTPVEGDQLVRYAVLTAYLVLGMVAFLLAPLFVRALREGPTEPGDFEPPGLM